MIDNKMKKQRGGLARLYHAFFYSLSGLKSAWYEEKAFRQEVFAACVFIPVALIIPVSLIMKLFLIGSVFLVMVVELLNSAVEAIVDMVSPDFHPLAKKAKDTASAAVLITLFIAFIFWSVALFQVVSFFMGKQPVISLPF